ncbi:acylphosphatase [Chitinimonas sp.]|uniref:acylphosphatase n=1 Tax=Chitinimonas sp. TaxID=1934313 RepID=UPI002F92F7EA
MIARHLRIHGRVQGVGYRYAFENMAEQFGLRGWVRNRMDGTVEAHIEGDPAAAEAMVVWSRRGPPAASVSQVEVQEVALEGHRTFERRPTA